MGWETSSKKELEFASVAKGLGVQVDLQECHLNLLRIRELTTHLNKIFEGRRLKRGELKSLRGRMQFAESQIFGRATNRHMSAVSKFAELDQLRHVDDSFAESLSF